MSSTRYQHLLSPLKVGRTYLKNRLVSCTSMPHYIQGNERFPADSMIEHVIRRAKGGAGIVTFTGFDDPDNVPPAEDIVHFPIINQYDTRCQNYVSQLVECLHYYDAKASIALMAAPPRGVDVDDCDIPPFLMPPDSPPMHNRRITLEEMQAVAADYARQAKLFQQMGFDMCSIHFAYRGPLGAKFLSAMTNTRDDEFGGPIENRAKFPLMVYKAVRDACGEDFLIETLVSGEDPVPGGTTLEDIIKFAKMCEGYVDIMQLRAPDLDPNHPINYCLEETPWLKYAAAVKESGARLTVETVAGFTNLDTCERAIAEGKADLIGAARAWISNPNFGQLAYEGRGEDVVPCLRCNKCHVNTIHGPYLSVCSVNPEYGLEHQLKKMAPAPVTTPRKIAVIGGGPAGMEAAQVAANRGHKVTLFEQTGQLGGQLIPASVPDFKWTLKQFKDYIVRKTLENPNIQVRFYSRVEPGQLTGYDKVIVAIGADPIVLPIPGHDRANVMTGIDALNAPEKVKGTVAVIGGGEIGVEVGMFLAKQGHPATVLEMRDKLAADATPIHYYNMVEDAWLHCEGFSFLLKAKVTGITESGVTYLDEAGTEHTLAADTVIMAVGTRSRKDEAYAFCTPGTETTVIGDAEVLKTVQGAMRSGYAAGNNA